MTKQSKSAQAKVLAGLADESPLLLFAGKTVTTASINKASYSKHVCSSCHAEFAFGAEQDGVQPFCPNCGETANPVEDGENDVELHVSEESSLTAITCPHCQTANVVEDRTAEALNGKIACAACGNQVAFEVEPEEVDTGADPLLDDAETADEYDDDEDNAPIVGELDDEEDNGDESEADEEEAGKQCASDDEADEPKSKDEILDVNLSDVIDPNAGVEIKFDDSDRDNPSLFAFVGDVPAMKLEKDDAGDNEDVIEQASFHRACVHAAKKGGWTALASMGFKPVSIKLPVSKAIKAKVQADVMDEQKELEDKQKQLEQDVEQSCQLAALALANNYFKGKTSPLQEVMLATLEAAGVPQAKTLVKRAFTQSAPAHAAALMALAKDIMGRSIESRNELAENLDMVNPDGVDEDDEQDDDNAVEARLERAARPVTAATQTFSHGSSIGAQLRAAKGLPQRS